MHNKDHVPPRRQECKRRVMSQCLVSIRHSAAPTAARYSGACPVYRLTKFIPLEGASASYEIYTSVQTSNDQEAPPGQLALGKSIR